MNLDCYGHLNWIRYCLNNEKQVKQNYSPGVLIRISGNDESIITVEINPICVDLAYDVVVTQTKAVNLR